MSSNARNIAYTTLVRLLNHEGFFPKRKSNPKVYNIFRNNKKNLRELTLFYVSCFTDFRFKNLDIGIFFTKRSEKINTFEISKDKIKIFLNRSVRTDITKQSRKEVVLSILDILLEIHFLGEEDISEQQLVNTFKKPSLQNLRKMKYFQNKFVKEGIEDIERSNIAVVFK